MEYSYDELQELVKRQQEQITALTEQATSLGAAYKALEDLVSEGYGVFFSKSCKMADDWAELPNPDLKALHQHTLKEQVAVLHEVCREAGMGGLIHKARLLSKAETLLKEIEVK